MNRIGPIVALAAFALLSAGAASAQQRPAPVVPGTLPGAVVPEQRIEPAGELTQPAPAPVPPRLVQNSKRAQHDADARNCLTLATNKEVHRCSLKYRSHASRASVVRASAKKPAAKGGAATATVEPTVPAMSATPAEVAKPAAPRPGDTAKAQDLVKPMDVTKPSGTPKPVEAAKAPETAKPPVPPPAAKAPDSTKK